ncbi:hypothetical protein ACFFX1_52545 [Dactylosporangium sucinum]|uniref:V-type ATPase subunit n=1 Tax=Dactylosporangium sucinum TaxID=1424081 RepID=A0A917UEU3_9ACTN|nr:hypothetical protein [Dactylosporangium sucinum]GGM77415.1 hypothetical protein GCM10007977_093630 [Dactylosporangium sucinum]GGM77781.1 hypothetical protein GCM10007977_094060 [Dactylosporangium sucinum]
MSTGGAALVAGSVRARALVRRCIGPAAARRVALCHTLGAALDILASTPYGRDVRPGQGLDEAQEAVAATLLWHLRVLAGWQPGRAVATLRALAGWFEISDVERRLRQPGRPVRYRVGALATATPRLARAGTVDEVRAALAASAWGDPGEAGAHAVALSMRLAWAQGVAALPAARAWACGGAALLVARERWTTGRPLPAQVERRAAALLGPRALRSGSLAGFAAALPRWAAWPFPDITAAVDLWRGETRWWRRLERDGRSLLNDWRFGEGAALGAAATLAVDAWRTRAALACAADGGASADFDVIAMPGPLGG